MAKFTGLVANDARAVRPFRRRVLIPGIKDGSFSLRVMGSKGNWHLYVQRGRTLHRITGTPYLTQTQATLQGYALYKVKPSLYKAKTAA